MRQDPRRSATRSGITPHHDDTAVLRAVAAHPGADLGALSEHLGMPRPALEHALRRLEGAGQLERAGAGWREVG